jgi:thiosulfate/3-mercaptopyruvate sulfurtransferase
MTTVLIEASEIALLGPVLWLEAETGGPPSPDAVPVPVRAWDAAARDPAVGFGAPDFWEREIRRLGIEPLAATPVVFDDGRMTEAARVWFILQYFGIPCRVLNGGAAARPAGVASRLPDGPSGVVLRPGSGPVGLVDRVTLKDGFGAVTVLDARTATEFSGADRRGNPRGGHLPGAVSLPHADLLAGGAVKDAEAVGALVRQAGIGAGPVVTHCDAGGRAALAALALVEAGYDDVRAYYASFSDWSAAPACPVARD